MYCHTTFSLTFKINWNKKIELLGKVEVKKISQKFKRWLISKKKKKSILKFFIFLNFNLILNRISIDWSHFILRLFLLIEFRIEFFRFNVENAFNPHFDQCKWVSTKISKFQTDWIVWVANRTGLNFSGWIFNSFWSVNVKVPWP